MLENKAQALARIAAADSAAAQRVAEVPGALPALVAAAAAGNNAGKHSTRALARIAAANPGLAQRVAEVPGALPALVAAAVAGSDDARTAARAVGAIKSWAERAVAAAGTACAHCGAKGNKVAGKRMLVCTGCNTARYCSTDCQRLTWGTHKAACRAVAATSGSSGSL